MKQHNNSTPKQIRPEYHTFTTDDLPEAVTHLACCDRGSWEAVGFYREVDHRTKVLMRRGKRRWQYSFIVMLDREFPNVLEQVSYDGWEPLGPSSGGYDFVQSHEAEVVALLRRPLHGRYIDPVLTQMIYSPGALEEMGPGVLESGIVGDPRRSNSELSAPDADEASDDGRCDCGVAVAGR
jgi:hypothetical protein